MNIDSFINGPQRENDLAFCKKYIELSDYYWQLADEDIIQSVDSAMDSALTDYYGCKLEGLLKDKSIPEIKKYFMVKKIQVYSEIPESFSLPIRKKIDGFLLKRRLEAKRLKFIIPDYDKEMSVIDYYANYLVAQELKKRLELQLGKMI